MEGFTKMYMEVMMSTHSMKVVKELEIIFGGMLLVNFKRPLAWLLLLPVIVNLLVFEVLIVKQPDIGVLLILINSNMIYVYRDNYQSISV
jgi:hypothetical protein